MRASWVVLFFLSLAGCVSSSAVPCDDGRTCPAGWTCGTQQCFSPEEMKACEGLPDGNECQTSSGRGFCELGCATVVCGNGEVETGEVCDDGNTTSGDGCNGTCTSDETCGNGIIELAEECDPPSASCSTSCVIMRCGNGIVDPGEVCDDGNFAPNDGCYVDCQSDETCGNGILDFAKGEQCDDKNAIAFDGCGPCRLETLDWWSLPNSDPPALDQTAGVYDPARRTTVMFGGTQSNGIVTNATWEHNGTLWSPRFPRVSPSPRTNAMLTYDSARRRVVLFGGRRGSVVFNDTWEYDGVTWTQVTTPVSPPARFDGVLAYDSVRGRIVLFGGSLANNVRLDDTWELVGSTWTLQTYTTRPAAVSSAGGAFDPKRGVLVLYGGTTGSADTGAVWELDAMGWHARNSAPTARRGHRLVFDAASGTIVSVFGMVSNADTSDVIDYDGATWTSRTVAGTFEPRISAAASYDVARAALVVFGGHDSTLNTPRETGYSLINNTWTKTTPTTTTTLAPQLEGITIYDDLRRGRVRTFAGRDNAQFSVTNATYELDGNSWIKVDDPPDADPNYPGPRRDHALAYDSARGVAVVFGGRGAGAGSILGDTWELAGATWTKKTNATQPSTRMLAKMAYDSRRSVVVMFGGVDPTPATPINYDETWEYNGIWTLRTPAVKPPPSVNHAMAYDPRRGVTVLLTGAGETWEWNGTNWMHMNPIASPPPRDRAALAFDASRNTTVLTGGAATGSVSTIYSDSWEYDGTTWVPLLTNAQPNERYSHGLTYSASRHSLVVAGGAVSGKNGPVPSLDAWELQYAPAAAVEACETTFDYDEDGLAGCADPECWPVCNPTCPLGAPAAQCQTTPRCGDGTCSPVEDCHTCPTDCTTCTPVCGDFYCDPPENTTSCPGDC